MNDLYLYINGTLEGCVTHQQPPEIANFIELRGGDVYDCLIMTKPLVNSEVKQLALEKKFYLRYIFDPFGEGSKSQGDEKKE